MSIGLYIVLTPLYSKSVKKLQEKRFGFIKTLAIIIAENGAKVSKVKYFQLAQQALITFVIDDMDEYTFLYTCKDFSGEIHECDEGELKWVSKDSLDKIPLWEGDKVFLPMLDEREDFFTIKLVYENDRLVEIRK